MDVNYKQKITFMGMLMGATLGALGALMWLDHRAQNGDGIEGTSVSRLGYSDLARIATAAVALLRQINHIALEGGEDE